MKTSAVLLAAAAAGVANAVQGPGKPDGTKISCAKANASFCMASGAIVHCNEDAVGTTSLCSDDPTKHDGTEASCWESSKEAGDAVCVKNCMVYDGDSSSTFTAGTCAPTGAATTTGGASSSWSATTSSSSWVSVNSTVTTWTTATSTAKPTTTTDGGDGDDGDNSGATKTDATDAATSTGLAPTAGAAVNRAGGVLAAAGLVAAYLV